MRTLPVLLLVAFGLSACAQFPIRLPGGGGGTPTGGDVSGFLIVGTSNANNLNRRAADDFTRVYTSLSGCRVEVDAAARGGRRLIPDDARNGDWSPHSRGEVYDWALDRYRDFTRARPNVQLRGLLWNQGNDLRDIYDGVPGFTMDRYFAELEDLLDAFTRDYQVPVYYIQTGTELHADIPLAREFRAREATVCDAHPNCYNVAQLTDEIYQLAEACTTGACEQRYWHDQNVHFGDDAAQMIMEEAARNVVALGLPGSSCTTAAR